MVIFPLLCRVNVAFPRGPVVSSTVFSALQRNHTHISSTLERCMPLKQGGNMINEHVAHPGTAGQIDIQERHRLTATRLRALFEMLAED